MDKFSRLIVVSSIFVVVSLSLLFITVQNGVQIPVISDGINSTISTINGIFAKPVQFFSAQKDGIIELLDAYNENKELKQTIASLETQVAEVETLQKENDSLRQNLGISQQFTDKTIVSALVSVRTPVSWDNQLTISVGSNQGIVSDMLVMSDGGLIGIITDVYPNAADVKLLSKSDNFTKIPVRLSVNDEAIYGILSGYDTDTNSFIVSQLNSTADIPEGSNVVTSDLAGTIPANLQVGKVTSVKTSSGTTNKEIFVTPTASFSNIYSVLIVGNVG
ncbi:TPA: rod shape-determining protein MreC [Streptococcus suis]|uniref:Cell shape-determining protein MreC n=1 Tax=Streptococcus suis TaxID=1307 RepID=A0A116LSM8_STRSU|nr:rod shape-determining protein MreC [Streptococcus suis]MBY5022113.1 rod shape-determining protein MreC [Streptococcus suis]NQH35534.1 rod shape-determining protein MreC [Streptococcus suis]CYV08870.1 rod shape-determining protein MreC [Streptococcus suis]HEL1585184.1 rod shape-determining protein MreC [Streptococcus suis]HEL9645637.1 rod shape-determining protein MreC [Streptococcus suis]